MAEDSIRLDKWLWHARFCKSRSLAQKLCEGGLVDHDGRPVTKSHQLVRPGDVLTIRFERVIRTVTVLAPGTRRGPAPEARLLYDEPSPPVPVGDPDRLRQGVRDHGSGRPTKRDRRVIDRFTEDDD